MDRGRDAVAAGRGLDVGEVAVGGEHLHHLAHEEGVAGGPSVDQLGHARVGPALGTELHPPLHVAGPQAGQVEAEGAGLAGQLAQAVHHRCRGVDGHRAGGHDQQGGEGPQLAGQELDHPEAGRVGPLEVVDHHDQRPAGRGQDASDRGVQAHAVGTRIGRRWRVDGGQHRGEEVAVEDPRPLELASDLDQGPVGRLAGALGTAAPRHRRPRDAVGELLDQPGLADAGLAADHHGAPLAPGGRLGRPEQGPELDVAPEERAGPRARGVGGEVGRSDRGALGRRRCRRRRPARACGAGPPGPGRGPGCRPRGGAGRVPGRCRPRRRAPSGRSPARPGRRAGVPSGRGRGPAGPGAAPGRAPRRWRPRCRRPASPPPRGPGRRRSDPPPLRPGPGWCGRRRRRPTPSRPARAGAVPSRARGCRPGPRRPRRGRRPAGARGRGRHRPRRR